MRWGSLAGSCRRAPTSRRSVGQLSGGGPGVFICQEPPDERAQCARPDRQRRGMRRLQLARLGEAARPDQLDGLGDDRGEAVIVLAERLQQVDLVLRHKLH